MVPLALIAFGVSLLCGLHFALSGMVSRENFGVVTALLNYPRGRELQVFSRSCFR